MNWIRVALGVALLVVGASKVASFRFRMDYDEYQAQFDKISLEGYEINERIVVLEGELETAENESRSNLTKALAREKESLRELGKESRRVRAEKVDQDLIKADFQRSSLIIGSLALASCILLVLVEIDHTKDATSRLGWAIMLGLFMVALAWL